MQHEETATLEVLLKRLGLATVHKLFPEIAVTAEQEGWWGSLQISAELLCSVEASRIQLEEVTTHPS